MCGATPPAHETLVWHTSAGDCFAVALRRRSVQADADYVERGARGGLLGGALGVGLDVFEDLVLEK